LKNQGIKNICILLKDLPAGGAEKQAILLAKELTAYHKVTFVLFNNRIDEKLDRLIQQYQINLVILKGNKATKLFQFFKLLRSNKIDIIFSFLLTANVIGSLVGGLAGIKNRIGGIRNALLDPKKEKPEKLIHNFFSSLTIFNNHNGAEYYGSRGFEKNKIRVITNCITLPKDQHTKNIDLNLIKILTVGRFVEQKDHFTAILTIKNLVNLGYKNIQYTIVGYGVLENKIRQYIHQHKLNEVINVSINPANINDYYNQANIYLCTSLFEGISNTILEAMSFHLPIIATNVGDNKYLVENGHNGYLVEKQNIDQTTHSIIKLIDQPKLMTLFGEKSYAKVKAEFSPTRFTDNYLQLIKELDRTK